MSLILKPLNRNGSLDFVHALNKGTNLSGYYSVQAWEINTSINGDTSVSFLMPKELIDDVEICKGDWVELYSPKDLLNPVAKVQINSKESVKINECQTECYYYKVRGNTYPYSLNTNGYIYKTKQGQINYTDLSSKLITQLSNNSKNIFNNDTRYISKTNEYFQSFEVKNYATEYHKYLSDLGIINYFDNRLRYRQHDLNEYYQDIYIQNQL